jgi:hypothetical protein
MNESSWYDVVECGDLLQGDILLDCPILVRDRPIPWPLPDDFAGGFRMDYFDVVVMTQSCDLANDKVTDVLLAYVSLWTDIVHIETTRGNTIIKSGKFRKLLIEGSIPSLSLLHKREEAPALPWSVVDFHHLFTLPKSFLTSFAAAAGPRLRMRSPYREHLAQGFARYFMRVGLPHDARGFEKEGA